MKAKIHVTLKQGILDPQGKAIAGALARLGFPGVGDVRAGKIFRVEVGAKDAAEAKALATYHAASNDEDGIAKAIEQLVLA